MPVVHTAPGLQSGVLGCAGRHHNGQASRKFYNHERWATLTSPSIKEVVVGMIIKRKWLRKILLYFTIFRKGHATVTQNFKVRKGCGQAWRGVSRVWLAVVGHWFQPLQARQGQGATGGRGKGGALVAKELWARGLATWFLAHSRPQMQPKRRSVGQESTFRKSDFPGPL